MGGLQPILTITAVGLMVTSNHAFAWDDDGCVRVSGKVSTTIDTSTDCTSDVSLCAAGEITRDGLLGGDTYFTANGLGGAPVGDTSIVYPEVEPDTTWAYSGTFVITTCDGSLTLSNVGVFDSLLGPYSELQRVVDGDGIFEGATGTLFSYGFVKSDGSGFKGRIRGEICLAE